MEIKLDPQLSYICFVGYDNEMAQPQAAFRFQREAVGFCKKTIKGTAMSSRNHLHVFYMEYNPYKTEKSRLKDVMFCKKYKYYAGYITDEIINEIEAGPDGIFGKDKRKFD